MDYIGSDQSEEGSSKAVELVTRAATICYWYLTVIEETIKLDEIYTFSDIEMSDAYYWGTFSSKDDGTMSVDGIIAVENDYVLDVSGSINMNTMTGDATITDETGKEYIYTLNSEDLDS